MPLRSGSAAAAAEAEAGTGAAAAGAAEAETCATEAGTGATEAEAAGAEAAGAAAAFKKPLFSIATRCRIEKRLKVGIFRSDAKRIKRLITVEVNLQEAKKLYTGHT